MRNGTGPLNTIGIPAFASSSITLYKNSIKSTHITYSKIVNEIGEKIASIDLCVRKNQFCSHYISYVNGVSITGASLSKMLSDKIYAISGQNVWFFVIKISVSHR